MYRIRELNPQELEVIKIVVGALGLEADDESLTETFAGDFEYQVSYACNRFATVSGGRQPRLTANEMRTLERARGILANKEQAAAAVLTAPDRKVA